MQDILCGKSTSKFHIKYFAHSMKDQDIIYMKYIYEIKHLFE